MVLSKRVFVFGYLQGGMIDYKANHDCRLNAELMVEGTMCEGE